jgi:hypothetical protein
MAMYLTMDVTSVPQENYIEGQMSVIPLPEIDV